MKTKLLLTLPILIFVICASVFVVQQVNALPVDTYFWGGTTDGHTPSAYQGAGAFDASGVNVPVTDGDITGYAWGGHGYGWLSFEDADVAGCPIAGTCYSRRVGNTLQGWARMLAIKNAEALGRSGGWSGWVQLDGVTIDGMSALQGYAWSNELGFIEFSGIVGSAPTSFSVELIASPTAFFLPSGGSYSGAPVTLTWTVFEGPADSCTASSVGTPWSGSKDVSSGSDSIVLTNATNTFTITCDKGGDIQTDSVSVSVVCNQKSCGAGVCNSSTSYTLGPCGVSSCSVDSDCAGATGSPGGFREVAP